MMIVMIITQDCFTYLALLYIHHLLCMCSTHAFLWLNIYFLSLTHSAGFFRGWGFNPPLCCLSTFMFLLMTPPEKIVKISQKYIADPPPSGFPQIEYCLHIHGMCIAISQISDPFPLKVCHTSEQKIKQANFENGDCFK